MSACRVRSLGSNSPVDCCAREKKVPSPPESTSHYNHYRHPSVFFVSSRRDLKRAPRVSIYQVRSLGSNSPVDCCAREKKVPSPLQLTSHYNHHRHPSVFFVSSRRDLKRAPRVSTCRVRSLGRNSPVDLCARGKKGPSPPESTSHYNHYRHPSVFFVSSRRDLECNNYIYPSKTMKPPLNAQAHNGGFVHYRNGINSMVSAASISAVR